MYSIKRRRCQDLFKAIKNGGSPIFINVDYASGKILNNWMDSLSASFAGVQVSMTHPKLYIPCIVSLYTNGDSLALYSQDCMLCPFKELCVACIHGQLSLLVIIIVM